MYVYIPYPLEIFAIYYQLRLSVFHFLKCLQPCAAKKNVNFLEKMLLKILHWNCSWVAGLGGWLWKSPECKSTSREKQAEQGRTGSWDIQAKHNLHANIMSFHTCALVCVVSVCRGGVCHTQTSHPLVTNTHTSTHVCKNEVNNR